MSNPTIYHLIRGSQSAIYQTKRVCIVQIVFVFIHCIEVLVGICPAVESLLENLVLKPVTKFNNCWGQKGY